MYFKWYGRTPHKKEFTSNGTDGEIYKWSTLKKIPLGDTGFLDGTFKN